MEPAASVSSTYRRFITTRERRAMTSSADQSYTEPFRLTSKETRRLVALARKAHACWRPCSTRRRDIPSSPGVYAIYEHGVLVYIGSSDVLRNRIRQHVNSHRWNGATFKITVALSGSTARKIERKMIRRLRPRDNKIINVAQRVRGSGFVRQWNGA
jgi:hypothetical protein